ncbi:MAG: hypothetical protein A2428_11060 [Bdellovibrionales bacterium RIFOXYC1_FULL_54_43]|nr:MAG: hypothetical protein A2428_11060 [Bdellovibrionales bacterium RIFOXYC1_FULL_54_43]OFZ84380.1 MAG: hypothetical protein A2603_16000 [Bdellovibrionales bacterium RIFOXYD1_FULL_55_31]
MHLAPLIRDLAVITAIAGIVALVFQRIRQPVVLGYLVAGMIVGPHTLPFPLVTDMPNVKTLAELGVIFLMFTLGLEFSFRKLARISTSAGVAASIEVPFMFFLGYGAGHFLGWSRMDSIFLGSMISISSTTIIVKALDELGLKARRFSELIFGILIVEDLLAVMILVAVTAVVSGGSLSALAIAESAGRLALVVGTWFIAGYFVVPRFIQYVARFKSQEILVLAATGLCLCLAVFAANFHYSVALGAFIMGSILSESTESRRIEELVSPLRDLFAAIFFVSVGMLMDPAALWSNIGAVLLITCLTILGKVTAVTFGVLMSGQRLQTSILVGFGLAQIGEFSFIIATLGLSLGVMSDFLYPVIVAVALITTFAAPYLIKYSYHFAQYLEMHLPVSVKDAVEAYAIWREKEAAKTTRGEFSQKFLKWALNGFVVTAINVIIAAYGMPLLERVIATPQWRYALGWALGLILSSPFIWEMFALFRPEKSKRRRTLAGQSPASVMMQVGTISWIGLLSLEFFPGRYVALVTITLAGLFFVRLYREMEASYRWFEEGFLATFKEQKKTRRPADIYRELAPWEGHLLRVKIHPDSEVSGKRLRDSELRKKYGVNVVAIQRGSRTIVAPNPDHQLFPKDELLVLGTDEQVDKIRPLVESPFRATGDSAIERYELRRIYVGPSSLLLGRSIRQSRIREDYSAMVVGIERQGNRILNPESDVVIKGDDTLLLVGESSRLDELVKQPPA